MEGGSVGKREGSIFSPDCPVGADHFFRFLILDWWMVFGKIIGTVRNDLERGASLNTGEWESRA